MSWRTSVIASSPGPDQEIAQIGAQIFAVPIGFRGGASMWKPFGSIFGCCLAALPLIGCAGGYSPLPPQAGTPPAAVVATMPDQGVYVTRTAAPAAILVFMPGTGRDVFLPGDPALWAAQGFDVVMPRPLWTDRLMIADQQAAMARLLASAQALADAPIWLIGPSPTIDAVMPQLGPGQVSGIVVTSVTTNAGSCTRTVYYSNPGSGAEPKAVVKTSGDACATSPSLGPRQAPAGAVPVPQIRPNAPRIIETSIPAEKPAQQAFVQRLADEIKAPQPAS
jgi:hypothetical protein